MASRTKKSLSTSGPVTFDLPEELFTRLERSGVADGARTTSEIIRAAIDGFDFEGCTPQQAGVRRQISVRLGADQRTMLKRIAARKNTSIGELLRLAIEAMLLSTASAPKKKTVAPKKSGAKTRAKR